MAEHLNEYFSSVFIREDIRSLPAPEVKYIRGERIRLFRTNNCNFNNGS